MFAAGRGGDSGLAIGADFCGGNCCCRRGRGGVSNGGGGGGGLPVVTAPCSIAAGFLSTAEGEVRIFAAPFTRPLSLLAFCRCRTTAPAGKAADLGVAPLGAGVREVFVATSCTAVFCFGRKKPRGCILRSERRTTFRSCVTARSGIGSPK